MHTTTNQRVLRREMITSEGCPTWILSVQQRLTSYHCFENDTTIQYKRAVVNPCKSAILPYVCQAINVFLPSSPYNHQQTGVATTRFKQKYYRSSHGYTKQGTCFYVNNNHEWKHWSYSTIARIPFFPLQLISQYYQTTLSDDLRAAWVYSSCSQLINTFHARYNNKQRLCSIPRH